MSPESEQIDLFPFPTKRLGQEKLLEATRRVLEGNGVLLAQAPTGIGKTVAVLAPALEKATREKKTVVFLTPRHTQHKIVLDTVELINREKSVKISAVNIIGKKWLCHLPITEKLSTQKFLEHCRSLRKEKKCKYYNNTYKEGKPGELSKKALESLKKLDEKAASAEEAKKACQDVCPYEILTEKAKTSHLVIADYYHMFYPPIRDAFLNKTGKELEDLIVIVDEAHNLPDRVRGILSSSLSSDTMEKAIREAVYYNFTGIARMLEFLKEGMEKIARKQPLTPEGERYVRREELSSLVEALGEPHEIIEEMEVASDIVKDDKKTSYIGSVASFLSWWPVEGDAFVRISRLYQGEGSYGFSFSVECLDPSIVTRKVLEKASGAILMSGTLRPLEMYEDLLGVEKAEKIELDSPFPEENKLVLVVDTATTRYEDRNQDEYYKIAGIVVKAANFSPGNVGVFFPSHDIRDRVLGIARDQIEKAILVEEQEMTREQKRDILEQLEKKAREEGAVLFGVTGASFSEGVDYPGDLMNTVVIVGVPLARPDLKTRALQDYYDKKYGKGFEYASTYPAMNKVLQAAGRCIRSPTDRGVIVLVDKRFLWRPYKRLLPRDGMIYHSQDLVRELEYFFEGEA